MRETSDGRSAAFTSRSSNVEQSRYASSGSLVWIDKHLLRALVEGEVENFDGSFSPFEPFE